MIEPIMYVGLGFLAASLLALVIIPLVHDRAVRLTLRRINAAIPLSIEEIQAEQDQLRAEFAMSTRRLETKVEELRAQTASQRAELGKNTATINRLNAELAEKAAAIFALEVHDRALRNQLHAAEQLLTKNGATADHILANKLARITADLDQRSALADSQRIEIVALKTQVDTLKDQLALAYSTRVGSVARR
jgi:chromosome segregation ATPase